MQSSSNDGRSAAAGAIDHELDIPVKQLQAGERMQIGHEK
jgi:hypothetical protein